MRHSTRHFPRSFDGAEQPARDVSRISRHFTNSWAQSHFERWRQCLSPYKGVPNTHALEIGSFEGQSACWFLDNILTGHEASLTCVDVWKDEARERLFDRNTADYGRRLLKVKSSSSGFMCRRLGRGRREMYNFIYVDGDHRAGSCLMDAVLGWQLLARGGILLFDDCGEAFGRTKPGGTRLPRHAVMAFLSVRDDYSILHDDNQIIVCKA